MKKLFLLISTCLTFTGCGITSYNTVVTVTPDRLSMYLYQFESLLLEQTINGTTVYANINNEIPLCLQDEKLQFRTNKTYEIYDNDIALCHTNNTANTLIEKGKYNIHDVNNYSVITLSQTYPNTTPARTWYLKQANNGVLQFYEAKLPDNTRKMWTFKVVR